MLTTLESLMVGGIPNETLRVTLMTVLDISLPEKMWFCIHLGTATVCACLPTYGNLVKRAAAIASSLQKRYGSSNPQYLDVTKPRQLGFSTRKSDKGSVFVKVGELAGDNIHLVDIERPPQSSVVALEA